MSNRLSIRRATEHDAGSVAQLAGELGYPVDAALMRGRIRSVLESTADLLIVGLDASGAPVGWLQAHASHVVESGSRVEIAGLVVSPAMRRSGVGRSLVAAAECGAKSLWAEVMVVRRNARRVESHAFYPALGYASTKTQVVDRKPLVASPGKTGRTKRRRVAPRRWRRAS